jgi:hypothetical protein
MDERHIERHCLRPGELFQRRAGVEGSQPAFHSAKTGNIAYHKEKRVNSLEIL